MTMIELCEIEPRLNALIKTANEADRTPGHKCANRIWYERGGLREKVINLVGWWSKNPEINSEKHYDLAYQHIWNLLPDCDKCACMGYDENGELS